MRGFSLIEVIGALALVSIAAAFVAVHLIRVMQEERRRHEVQMADRLAEAFEQAIILHKTVPSTNPASWVPLLASQLGLPADAVGTNSIGTPRLLVYDPSLKIGTTTPASLPYVQGSAGATNVINPRVIILSGLQAGYPPVDFSSAAGFSNLWNRADHTLPMDWPANWAADPDDLVVRRLDLSGLFHEVVFNNLDPFHPAPYAVLTNTLAGGGHANVIAVTNQPVAGRFIRGTPLRLSYANGQPQVVNIVTSDASYVFEQGRWNRSAQSGLTGPATYGPLGALVEAFINHPGWSPTDLGTTPESVVLGMFDILCGCRDWAEAGFENENGHSKWEAPTARFVFDVAPQLMLSSEDLIDM